MIRGNSAKALFFATIATGAWVVAMHAQAGTLGNGAAQRQFKAFGKEGDAQQHCPNDKVLWASSAQHRIFYMNGTGPQRNGGVYACMADITKAGWRIKSGG